MNPVTLKCNEMRKRLNNLEQMLEISRSKHEKEAWVEIEHEIEALKSWLHQLKDPSVQIPNKDNLIQEATNFLDTFEQDPYGPNGESAHLNFQERAKELLEHWS